MRNSVNEKDTEIDIMLDQINCLLKININREQCEIKTRYCQSVRKKDIKYMIAMHKIKQTLTKTNHKTMCLTRLRYCRHHA